MIENEKYDARKLHTVTYKIMYTVIIFFFLGLSCSVKKGGGNLEKFI